MLFDYLEYKDYLREKLPVSGEQRGQRKALATMLGCQTTFISQVLNMENVHLSLEHAILVSEYFQHTHEEKEYFLQLVQFAKAGSKKLQNHYLEKIHLIQVQRQNVDSRVKGRGILKESETATYYSRWYYSAIHIACTLKQEITEDYLEKRLGLKREILIEALQFLLKTGLIIFDGTRYLAGNKRIHVDKGTPLAKLHHSNWRIKTVSSLDAPDKSDLHFTNVMTLSKKDFKKISELILETIEKTDKILMPSPEEELYTLNIDFYKV